MADEETPPTEDGVPAQRRRPLLVAALAALAAVAVIGVGSVVVREDWERTGPPIEVASWAPYWQTHLAYDSFDANVAVFGDVSIVAYHAVGAGEIVPYEGLASDATERFVARARPEGVPLLVTIFDDTESGVMAGLLADPGARTAHVSAIAELVVANDFDGVDLDYEMFAFSDARSTWDTTRPNWIAFLEELTVALHGRDKLVVVSIPHLGYTVYDHEATGEIVDRIRIMTYDYSTGEPGPIAPTEWVREVVDDLKDIVPPEKIDLGIPAYGRDWVVSVTGTCPADQEPRTRSVTPSSATASAAEHGVQVQWDEEAEEARFDYAATLTGVDVTGAPASCTVSRTVWFLEERAIHRRAWIAHREDLHGVAIWALGNDDPAMWTAIRLARDGVEEHPSPSLPPYTTAAPPTT
jgi:spore germination protein YaaH